VRRRMRTGPAGAEEMAPASSTPRKSASPEYSTPRASNQYLTVRIAPSKSLWPFVAPQEMKAPLPGFSRNPTFFLYVWLKNS
jgi:hypothetical protein